MKLLILIICWCILVMLCWPIALLVLVLFPLFWILTLPFRIVAIVISAALALLRGILFLPARLLGVKR